MLRELFRLNDVVYERRKYVEDSEIPVVVLEQVSMCSWGGRWGAGQDRRQLKPKSHFNIFPFI